jgi:uncharacterized protein (DUF1501 family)
MDGINSMHPAMASLAQWYQRGEFGVVKNVGYVNPNLSHFTSMDYFESGYVPGKAAVLSGWVARMHDNACGCQVPNESLFFLGSGVRRGPRTFARAQCYIPPTVRDPATYHLRADTDEAYRFAAINGLNSAPVIDETLDYVQRTENIMEASIADIATADATHLWRLSVRSQPMSSAGMNRASTRLRISGFSFMPIAQPIKIMLPIHTVFQTAAMSIRHSGAGSLLAVN